MIGDNQFAKRVNYLHLQADKPWNNYHMNIDPLKWIMDFSNRINEMMTEGSTGYNFVKCAPS